MKNNEDYLHLLEGVEKPRTWSRGKFGIAGNMIYNKFLEEARGWDIPEEDAMNITDHRMIQQINDEVRRMADHYTGRAMDDYAYHSIRAGINNILEHYELSNGIYQSRYEVREAWDEGAYYVTLEIQPRQPLEYVTVNIRL